VKPVAVVIPLYQGRRWVGEAIASAALASRTSPEMIVVDDGSTDDSGDVALVQLQALRHGRLVRQPNGGVAAARDRGLAEAGPQIGSCLFLDQDDLLVAGAIDRLLAALESHPQHLAVTGRAGFIDEEGKRLRNDVAGVLLTPEDGWGGSISFARLAYQNCIVTPGQVLIRTPGLRALGGFRGALAPCDDWDLWLRLLRLGSIGVVDEVTTLVRRHANNVSRNFQMMRKMDLKLRTVAYAEAGPSERELLQRGHRRAEQELAAEWLRVARQSLAKGQLAHTARLTANATVFRLWALVGVQAHAATMRALHRLARARPPLRR